MISFNGFYGESRIYGLMFSILCKILKCSNFVSRKWIPNKALGRVICGSGYFVSTEGHLPYR